MLKVIFFSVLVFAKPDACESLQKIPKSMCQVTNEIRKKNGLSELQVDERLMAIAADQAKDMKERNYFSHNSSEGKTPFDRMHDKGIDYHAAAENIARGRENVDDVFRGWLDSPGHKKNLLNPKYNHQGVGFYEGFWVHDFTD